MHSRDLDPDPHPQLDKMLDPDPAALINADPKP